MNISAEFIYTLNAFVKSKKSVYLVGNPKSKSKPLPIINRFIFNYISLNLICPFISIGNSQSRNSTSRRLSRTLAEIFVKHG